MPKDPKKKTQPLTEESLIEALRRGGFIVPETDEDARRCLDRFSDSPVTLPPGLENSNVAVSRILGDQIHLPEQSHASSETEQAVSLKRAARKGGTITPEIEEKMRRAREQGSANE